MAEKFYLDGGALVARLTDAEFALIFDSADINVRRWIEELRMRGFAILSDAKLANAKAYLVNNGFLTQPRADTVFGGE